MKSSSREASSPQCHFLAITVPDCQEVFEARGCGSGNEISDKKTKGAANLRSLLLACTLPQVLRQTKLLQRSGCCRAGAHSDSAAGYVAHHGVFVRAEGANAGLVRGNWIRADRIAVRRYSGRASTGASLERIAALDGGIGQRQNSVNEAAGRGRRCARSRTAQIR